MEKWYSDQRKSQSTDPIDPVLHLQPKTPNASSPSPNGHKDPAIKTLSKTQDLQDLHPPPVIPDSFEEAPVLSPLRAEGKELSQGQKNVIDLFRGRFMFLCFWGFFLCLIKIIVLMRFGDIVLEKIISN